jgi:hypothetical protein
MAILPNVFIPEETDENPFAPIDERWYPAEITKSEVKSTKDKQGKYIAFSFKVDEDDQDAAGRMVYTNLNIINKNETAVKIAQADLKAICVAVGHEGELEDTEDLHGITMCIKVSIKAETSQWPAKNEIKAFKNIDELEALNGGDASPLED